MYWYAAEPLGGQDAARALELGLHAKTPRLLDFMVRRLVQADAAALTLVIDGLNKTDDPETQLAILRGLNEGLKGRRDVPMPKEWRSPGLTTARTRQCGRKLSPLASFSAIRGRWLKPGGLLWTRP